MNDRPGIPIALQNIRSTCHWRIGDIVNWHQLLQPLRQFNGDAMGLHFYRMAYDLCTRFVIDYRPCPDAPTSGRPEPAAGRPSRASCPGGEPRVALFVDAPDHTSGVSTTLAQWGDAARARGLDLSVFSAGHRDVLPRSHRFQPMGILRVPLYGDLELPVPRVRDVMEHLAPRSFDVVHISTPGPMGLLGLMAALRWNVPVVGTYHTDFPAYATRLAGDAGHEDLVWLYMHWFYGCMDKVAAPSVSTRHGLLQRGLPPRRVSVVGRGVDTSSFSPAHRDEGLRAIWGLKYPHKLLYVGRISEEKNLSCLADAFRELCRRRHDTCLVVVGEGPYQDEMARKLAGLPVTFTGLKQGEELSRIYASCDLFAFPSETDTFGVVVIEAQASGLPVLVSGLGGPRDIVADGVDGRVVHHMTPVALADAVEATLEDPAGHQAMRTAAVNAAAERTPASSFEAFWQLHRDLVGRSGPARAATSAPSRSPWRTGARSLAGV
jgi:glycosyltransferase involved in cell wall biosynthesis